MTDDVAIRLSRIDADREKRMGVGYPAPGVMAKLVELYDQHVKELARLRRQVSLIKHATNGASKPRGRR